MAHWQYRPTSQKSAENRHISDAGTNARQMRKTILFTTKGRQAVLCWKKTRAHLLL
jgi:hypothetical protein